MKKLSLLVVSFGVFLSGCSVVGAIGAGHAMGSVGNAVVSDETLQRKAAFALDTDTGRVKISNRETEGEAIDFTATVGKKSYQCYVTVAFSSVSDAICSGGGKKAKALKAKKETNQECNALLQAAGRC